MKIQRKYMAHYLNAAFGEGTASYVRLGRDLEEYAPEMSANVEKKTNILGQTSVVIDSYQKQGEVTPFYAEDGDPLFEKLQAKKPEEIIRHAVKGMLPDGKLGRQMLKKLKVYAGPEHNHAAQKPETWNF